VLAYFVTLVIYNRRIWLPILGILAKRLVKRWQIHRINWLLGLTA